MRPYVKSSSGWLSVVLKSWQEVILVLIFTVKPALKIFTQPRLRADIHKEITSDPEQISDLP
ncbi:hypothetical protein EMIT0P201_10476 [Pseudomonas chlororaphis]